MANLTHLKFKRGQNKASLTRVVTYFNGIKDSNLDEGIITQLKLRLDRLEPVFNEFSQTQSEIEYYLETEASQAQDNQSEILERDNFEATYFDIVSKITTLINSFQTNDPTFKLSSNNDNVSANFPNSPPAPNLTKLPTLKLPTFSGSIEKWLEFRDIYVSLVQNNCNLDKVQKFYYLRACLEKEAAQLIESIPVTHDNYDVAWTSLTERYENKRLIVFSYVKSLFEVPVVSKENVNDLRCLYDTFTKNLRSLENLGQPVKEWDTLLIHLIVSKLDYRTRRDWEANKIKGDLPTMQEIGTFLKDKCELLEKLNISKADKFDNYKSQNRVKYDKRQNINSFIANQTQNFSCYFCKKNHSIFKCEQFLELSTIDRERQTIKLKLCLNCFNPHHTKKDCKKSTCKKCNRRHNTLLHRELPGEQDAGGLQEISANSATEHSIKNTVALLSTAIVKIQDKDGNISSARMLLDPGSQSNFITEKLTNILGLNKTSVKYSVSGIGNSSSLTTQFKVSVNIMSRVNDYSKNISCLILRNITQRIPSYSFNSANLNIPKEIILADPHFNHSNEIDILCGVGLFYDLLLMNQIRLDNGLILQDTQLGWVLGGEINSFNLNRRYDVTSCHCINDSEDQLIELNNNLTKFWQVEECLKHEVKDDFCEKHFLENFKRDADGRFIVKIPFKQDRQNVGKSKEMALRRFSYLEKRLAKNDNLKGQYVQFMIDYEKLGHMKELLVDINNLTDDGSAYYVPHHAVLKDSNTTPCRVVFDFSAKTNKNLSLNDIQFSGPVIQSDLLDILLRFRSYKFIISADISKMYRQVWVNSEHTPFQRIFWRASENEKIKCYELLTVTYGMASSPYLATRTLNQLAEINKINYPRASQSIKDSFYVDDYLDGENNETDIINLQLNVSKILQDAGFQLRKWLTNEPQLFDEFGIDKKVESSILKLGENENNKTLGVFWNANSDTIEFIARQFGDQETITKRFILSVASQIFDPMGLISPVIIKAKMLLQSLWKEKLSWDEPVTGSLKQNWLKFSSDLQLISSIKIPRLVLMIGADWYEMHTFVDASERAYGACVYVRSKYRNEYFCNLICAKSKVCPIKQLTLPRLELCAAFLGARLADRVKRTLKVEFQDFYFWTDSLVVYHWINGTPDRWKTFIANRVSAIQTLSNIEDWHHVKSGDNPADIISRGTTANKLTENNFWFHGPSWLEFESSKWPTGKDVPSLDTIPEERLTTYIAVSADNFNIFDRFSSLEKLKRVTAYCLRFSFNLKNSDKKLGTLSVEEINDAFYRLVKLAQRQTFSRELRDLERQGSVEISSNILKLRPFLDSNSIIRVGGRVTKAKLPYEQRHPIIISKKHHLTKLIMTYEHEKLLHCGPQQLLYSIRENFWPLSGRDLARNVVHNCIVCFKAYPKACEYIMGNLPTERLNPCFPFSNVGCDYAGPFYLKDRKGRKPILSKAWACLFICMTTRAMHLELVTDLSTQSFLACFKRFISRRGKPSIIFSDNGTQFTGANAELLNFVKNNKEIIEKYFTDEEITWKFIPPRSPHFGGMWESGVKSVKHHLKRVIGNNKLHFDEFCTVLCQIEAILNSRPLTPLSSSPDDYSPLTPAHFLIGHPLTSLPEPNYVPLPDNRLDLFKCRQKMVQLFWKKWSKEYIGELQTRLKWSKTHAELLQVGSLVIVKDDNLPPLFWKMARVLTVHPGDDNVIRVATVKFGDGSVAKRPIRKLCVLPINDQLSQCVKST